MSGRPLMTGPLTPTRLRWLRLSDSQEGSVGLHSVTEATERRQGSAGEAQCKFLWHLATSFYSFVPSVHDAITTRRNSQQRTLANIRSAVSRNIPLQVGIIDIHVDQQLDATVEFLRTETGIIAGYDRMRGDGRDGERLPIRCVDELCGNCANSNAAIDPNGLVYPCVMSRWLVIGDVSAQSLREVLRGKAAHAANAQLWEEFAQRDDTRSPWSKDCRPFCRPDCCPV
jgi:hypothetical protein